MLVVIPVCKKDEQVAFKNLEVAISLDKKTSFDCLLATEFGYEATGTEILCKSYFNNVHKFKYDPPPSASWPQAPNHVWQSVAREIKSKYKVPWLFLEPDVTPLRKGWLEELWKEYQRGAQPFMGHIVNGEGMGHMNGVGIYPFNISSYSTNALLVSDYPFDRMLWKDIENITHKANDLIAHFPRFTGVQLAFNERKPVKKLQDKGYLIFHGCNDGSLADIMMGRQTPIEENGKILRFFTEEDLTMTVDESEPFWQQESTYLRSRGYKVIDYSECRKQIPSFQKQLPCETGVFHLPKDFNLVHFNSGLATDGNDKWLLTRQWKRMDPRRWQSYLVMWHLSGMTPINPIQLRLPDDRGLEQYEDPRVTFHDGRFHVSYGVWQHLKSYKACQRLSILDRSFNHISTWHPNYGKNGIGIGYGTGCEKNWVWFVNQNSWHFVYSTFPHVVIKFTPGGGMVEFKTQIKNIPWRYGEIRGGTPPVLVGDKYYSFFHSSLPWKHRQKRYYVGAYEFESQEPFRITGMTNQWLWAGSDEDTRDLGGPLVVFPAGALYENNQWLITAGINDESTGWMKLPHSTIMERMSKV